MPSQIVHALAGHMALDQSRIAVPGLNSAAFNLGCQGPDIFSHNRRTKPFALSYSRMLHRHGYGSFCASFARLLSETPDSLGISWFLGFITHQEVDRALHPYIINRSHITKESDIPGLSPAIIHAFFERILDVALLGELEGKPVSAFDTGKPFRLEDDSCRRLAALIGRALVDCYAELPDANDIELRILNAFSDSMYFYRITNPLHTDMHCASADSDIPHFTARGAAGVALLYPCDIESGTDWLNLALKPWKHPGNGEKRRDSAVTLFRLAVARSIRVLSAAEAVLKGDRSSESLAEEIGDSCLSISGDDGHIAPVRVSEPFDLIRTLKVEVERRRVWLETPIC